MIIDNLYPICLIGSYAQGQFKMVLYLQDILIECGAPEKFHKPANSDGNDIILIVDFGSWQCRAGLSNEAEPSRKNKNMITFVLIAFWL